MDFKTAPASLIARILAVISLAMGLADAGRLLGVWGSPMEPLASMGQAGFVVLAILAISRLFAALGLWMQVQWGAVVLAGSLALEILAYLFGPGWVALSLYGFIFKLVALLATIALLLLAGILDHRRAAE